MHGDQVGAGGRGVPSASWEESRVSEVGSLQAASAEEGQRGIPAGVGAGVGAPPPLERQPSATSPPPLVIIAARVCVAACQPHAGDPRCLPLMAASLGPRVLSLLLTGLS